MPGEIVAPETPKAPEGKEEPQGSDVLEVILEGMDKPTKIPLEKLKPDLAKFRADADRKLSEADKIRKDSEGKLARYTSMVEKAKADPDAFSDLAKELGVSEEQLDKMSEKRVAKALEKALREADEQQDPAKKEQRERKEETDKLRKENEELRGKEEARADTERVQKAESVVISVLDKMGAAARNPESAQEVVWTLRVLVNEKEAELGRPIKGLHELGDAASPENLAKLTLSMWGKSTGRYYEVHPEAEIPESLLKRAEAIIDKRRAAAVKHPAEGKGGTTGKNGKHDLKEGQAPASTAVLMKYLKM